MQEDSRLPGTRRPGGRTARTRTAVFEAATAELAEKGYAGTSLDRIAARAGVAVSTVYRRWGTLQSLIQELVGDFTVEMADLATGTLEGDLAEAARAIVTLYRHPVHRFWMDAMVAAAVHDEAARRTLSGVIASRIRHVAESLAPAAEREQAPPGTDLTEAVRMLAAPFYYRMYISGERLTDDLVGQGAAAVAAAIRSGALVPAT
jgi:AcrR family transcriptional regulator